MALIKQEPMEEEEVQPSTSGEGKQKREVKGADYNLNEFDDEYITK